MTETVLIKCRVKKIMCKIRPQYYLVAKKTILLHKSKYIKFFLL